MRIGIIMLALVALGGCAQDQAQRQAQAQAQLAANASDDDAKCKSYGVTVGSPAYVQCRMNFDNLRAQDEQQRRNLAVQYLIAHPF